MTELLPGPEDPGKHLFEISPGRPERLHLCAGAGPGGLGAGGAGCRCSCGLGRAIFTTLLSAQKRALSLSTVQKFGSNLDDIVNLGRISKTQSIV